jgi:hypothetical protein
MTSGKKWLSDHARPAAALARAAQVHRSGAASGLLTIAFLYTMTKRPVAAPPFAATAAT